MRLLDSEIAHERPAVVSLLRDSDYPLNVAAARITDTMVTYKAVTIRKGWLVHHILEPIGADARVDQHDGFSGSPNFKLKFYVLQDYSVPDLLFHAATPFMTAQFYEQSATSP